MLYPNGQRVLASTHRPMAGALAACGALQYGGIKGALLNRYVSGVQAKTAAAPDGYSAPALPIKPGGMSALVRVAQVDGVASLLQGAPMEGSASVVDLSAPDAGLSLVVGLSGSASVLAVTGDGAVLSLTVGLDGSASWSFSGAGALSMVVPFEGAGTVVQLSGTADLRGLLSMAGEWTPYAELSPESLARAVWDAVAAQYNEPGSTGQKLNTASSGGVDINALATAVWAYAQRSLSGTQATQLAEIWQLHGLDPSAPLAVTDASRTTGTVAQALVTAAGTTTVTRTA